MKEKINYIIIIVLYQTVSFNRDIVILYVLSLHFISSV